MSTAEPDSAAQLLSTISEPPSKNIQDPAATQDNLISKIEPVSMAKQINEEPEPEIQKTDEKPCEQTSSQQDQPSSPLSPTTGSDIQQNQSEA